MYLFFSFIVSVKPHDNIFNIINRLEYDLILKSLLLMTEMSGKFSYSEYEYSVCLLLFQY
jgi:hypothetical protein